MLSAVNVQCSLLGIILSLLADAFFITKRTRSTHYLPLLYLSIRSVIAEDEFKKSLAMIMSLATEIVSLKEYGISFRSAKQAVMDGGQYRRNGPLIHNMSLIIRSLFCSVN